MTLTNCVEYNIVRFLISDQIKSGDHRSEKLSSVTNIITYNAICRKSYIVLP